MAQGSHLHSHRRRPRLRPTAQKTCEQVDRSRHEVLTDTRIKLHNKQFQSTMLKMIKISMAIQARVSARLRQAKEGVLITVGTSCLLVGGDKCPRRKLPCLICKRYSNCFRSNAFAWGTPHGEM